MNKKLLMSFEEYSKTKHETPYFYSVISDNRLLYYFGANHSRDYKHSQYKQLIEKWEEFVNKSKGKDITIVVESAEFTTKCASLKEYIRRYGEFGAGVYLAQKDQATVVLGEPKTKEIIDHLLKKYSKDEILLFFESIASIFWFRNKTGKNIQEFFSEHTEKYRKLLDWPDLNISMDIMSKIYQKIFNKELNFNNENIFLEITSPVIDKSKMNKLSRDQSLYRNLHILEKIEDLWNRGENIFIIYGAGHAVMQEPVILTLKNI